MIPNWSYFPGNDFWLLSTAPEQPVDILGSVWRVAGGYMARNGEFKRLGVVGTAEEAKAAVDDYLEGKI